MKIQEKIVMFIFLLLSVWGYLSFFHKREKSRNEEVTVSYSFFKHPELVQHLPSQPRWDFHLGELQDL